MPVQVFLSDEERVCVACGTVSNKGIVAQVGTHRFFLCAWCLTDVVPELLQVWPPIHSHTLLACVCCGQDSSKGIAVHVGANWFFLCSKCTREVLPTFLHTWRQFGDFNSAHRWWWRKFDRTLDAAGIERFRRFKLDATIGPRPVSLGMEIVIDPGDQAPFHIAGRCEESLAPLYPEILICPICGQKYCQYCGQAMGHAASDRCPHCGGVPSYHPLHATITVLDDISPADFEDI